jgi:hypothetical protein
MKLEKISQQLLERIDLIHQESYEILNNVELIENYSLNNSGNIGIFCQSDREYLEFESLMRIMIKGEIEEDKKYQTLSKEIIVEGKAKNPDASYKYIYIRKYDPTAYGKHIGDIDLYVDNESYETLKSEARDKEYKDIQIYHQTGVGD